MKAMSDQERIEYLLSDRTYWYPNGVERATRDAKLMVSTEEGKAVYEVLRAKVCDANSEGVVVDVRALLNSMGAKIIHFDASAYLLWRELGLKYRTHHRPDSWTATFWKPLSQMEKAQNESEKLLNKAMKLEQQASLLREQALKLTDGET